MKPIDYYELSHAILELDQKKLLRVGAWRDDDRNVV